VHFEVPSLSNVQLVSNNTNNSSLAKAGEVITLSFSSSEGIDRPSVTLGGETKLAFGSDTSWTTTYEVKPGDDAIISSPMELEGLVLWLDAENVDGENNNSLFDGAEIKKWEDISGNGNHAIGTSFSNSPTLINDGNQNFIRFDSSEKQSLALNDVNQLRFGPNEDFSYAIVLKSELISDVHEAGILSKRNGYEGYQLYVMKDSGKTYSYLGQPESPYLKTVSSNPINDGQLHILFSKYERESYNYIFQNGIEIGSSNISSIKNSETDFPLEIGHEFYSRHSSKYYF
jgi:hypothetical protein